MKPAESAQQGTSKLSKLQQQMSSLVITAVKYIPARQLNYNSIHIGKTFIQSCNQLL